MIRVILLLGLIILIPILVWQYTSQPNHNLVNPLSRIKQLITSKNLLPTPTIDQIFQTDHSWTATLSAQKKVTIIATGDIIPARSVNYQVISRNDPTWPYLRTADFTRNADLTFSNLETPLIDDCALTQEGMVFCGTSRNGAGLKFAGVDLVSLANNHAGNHGAAGVEETKIHLTENGIQVTGAPNPLVVVIKGTRFAFLGFNDISAPQPGVVNADELLIRQQIADTKKIADVVIVTYHWGIEYRDQPDERQIYLGHLTIDAGADLVIGNHPHWIQPVEFYKGKLITYAHGNYIFDQMWSEKTKLGVLGKYTFYENQLVDIQYFPLRVEDYGQAYFLEGTQKQGIIDHLKNQSLILDQVN